jgi:hypothetical protein
VIPRARRATAIVLAVAGACACIMHLSACKDDGTHVYVGRFYLEARGCLGTSSSLDVVTGNEPGTCNPICLIQRRPEGGRAVYVATMCPPYPSPVDFDTSGTDAICAPALAALARGDTCATDGGSSHPLPPPQDAGAD